MESTRKHRQQWRNELNDIIRGASGGFLFGIPLLYTMEVWWIGSSAHMVRLLMALVLTFVIVFMLNRTAGFRQMSDIYAIDAAIDSVEAMAIGLVCAGSMLILIREITAQTPLNEAIGKLIYVSTPFTLGVALANQFLSGQEEEAQKNDDSESNQASFNATFSDIGSTLIGAIIIAFNIAPTDEIPTIAAAVSGLWLLTLMAASLLVSYAIVFAAGFTNQQKRQQQEGIFQNPYSETLISYLISLLAACMMLVFFDKLHGQDPWHLWLSYSIILGLPATIGGAAGRLAI